MHPGQILGQFFHLESTVKHQTMAGLLTPHHLGKDLGKACRLDPHRLAQHQPFGAFDTGALLGNIAHHRADLLAIGNDDDFGICVARRLRSPVGVNYDGR